MKKAQVLCATVALTWAFVWSRLSESNRRPIHTSPFRPLIDERTTGSDLRFRTHTNKLIHGCSRSSGGTTGAR